MVHVLTKKGKGFALAEQDPIKFHGVTPFHVLTGKAKKDKSPVPTYTEIFGQALVRLAKENPKIVGITAAMGSGTGIDKLQRELPERTYDVGIAEQHAVTFAAGMATEGYVPVVAIYSTFLQRGYDEILHDVCLQNLHVVLALDRGGLVGADGPTHHGVFDFAYHAFDPQYGHHGAQGRKRVAAYAQDRHRAFGSDFIALSARRRLGRRARRTAAYAGDRQSGAAARRHRSGHRCHRQHGDSGAQSGARLGPSGHQRGGGQCALRQTAG